jgi:hypothetical protein
MDEIAEQLKENEMPLDSYSWMHREAKLTEAEKATLINWAVTIQDSLEARYPMDSLVRKK